MGAISSTALISEDINELQDDGVPLTTKQIHLLYKRFCALDKEEKGAITSQDLMSLPEFAMNPLAHRIIALMDVNQNDHINFKRFVQFLSTLSKDGDPEAKIELAFKIYDINEDGYITEDELMEVLKMMVGNSLDEFQVEHIVSKQIDLIDSSGEGRISFEDFKKSYSSSNLADNMTIAFSKREKRELNNKEF